MSSLPPGRSGSSSELAFLKLVRGSLALSFAGLAALIAAIEEINPTLKFKIDASVVGAAFLAGIVTWVLGNRWIHRLSIEPSHTDFSLRQARGTLAAIVTATIVTFGYFLKDLPPSTLKDMTIGSSVAIIVLLLFAALIWRVTCFLRDSESETDGPSSHQPTSPKPKDHTPTIL